MKKQSEEVEESSLPRLPLAVRRSSVDWGIVGCGWVARDYVAPAIRDAANARLVALYDCDERAAGRIAENAPGATVYSSLDHFLEASELDAVYIATPNDSHARLTERVARAGRHVLCEKPMATSYDDARRMVGACESFGVRYATAFDQRFHARHRALRELIAAGALGTITHVRVHYACWNPPDWRPPTDDGTHDNWRVRPERAGGGAMIDLAPHGLDLVQHLLDEEVAEIICLMQRRAFDYAVDDGAVLIGRFPSGALLSMNVAYNCPDEYPRRTLEIIGTEARALAVNTMGQTPGGTLTLTSRSGATEEVFISPEVDVSPFRSQIEAFSRALLGGAEFPFPPARDLHTMRLIEIAQRQGAPHVREPVVGLTVSSRR